jgi:hypothetical protein
MICLLKTGIFHSYVEIPRGKCGEMERNMDISNKEKETKQHKYGFYMFARKQTHNHSKTRNLYILVS